MTDKVWMITGASRGFGAKIAEAALAAGDRVIASARDPKTLRLAAGDGQALPVALDVTDPGQVRASVEAGLTKFGRIDVLVNNAAYGLLGAVEESSDAEIEAIFQTNVFGLLRLTRAVLPHMRRQRSGHIVNMSSVGGFSARPGWGVYSATKFAVEAITESLHAEVAPLGIRVTAVEPGSFRTDFLDGSSLVLTTTKIDDYADTVGKMRAFVVDRNHQQPGDPEKLARAVLEIVRAEDPPVRLPLGSDTLRRVAEKLAAVQKETERWRDLSASTDIR